MSMSMLPPIPAPLQAALIDQFNFERFSAEVYGALSAALDAINLEGFSAYLNSRSTEERQHAGKFSTYLADRGARPVFSALVAPVVPAFVGPMEGGKACFTAALAHEVMVTERLSVLYALAYELDDPQTCEFLRWFIAEQTEEMATLDVWLTKFELASGNGAAILFLDHEAGG